MVNSALQDTRQKVWAVANTAARISDLDGWGAELLRLREQSPKDGEELLQMLMWVATAAERLHEPDSAVVDFFRLRILPTCLESSDDLEHGERLMRSDLRKLLSKWLNRGSHFQLPVARMAFVDLCVQELREFPRKEILWTISAIGLRQDDLVEALIGMINRGGSLAGEALRALITLGVRDSDRQMVRELARSRLRDQADSRDFWAFVEVADLEDLGSLDYLAMAGIASDPIAPVPTAAARLAEKFWTSIKTQDRLLALALKAGGPSVHSASFMRSDILPKFNTRKVINELMGAIATKDVNGRLRIYGLLGACVRPQQVQGWTKKWPESTLSVILEDAAVDSRQSGVAGRTIEGQLKEDACLAALRSGGAKVADRLAALIERDGSKLMRGQLLGLLACFKPRSLPKWVSEGIEEQVDGGGHWDAGDFVFRRGCVEVAQSSATVSALRSLIQFGFTSGGQVIVQWSEAIGEVAAHLVRQGSATPKKLLLDAVEKGRATPRGLAALDGFRHLARQGLLSAHDVLGLIGAVGDTELPTYGKNFLLEIIALVPESMGSSRVLQSVMNFLNASEGSSWYALYALAHCRNFEQHAPEIHLKLHSAPLDLNLDVDRRGEIWRLRAAACGVLCVRDARSFSAMAIDVLRDGTDEAVYSIARSLYQSCLLYESSLSREVLEAFRAAVISRHSAHRADSGLLRMLAWTSVADFLRYDWRPHVSKWLSDGRVGFLEVLYRLPNESLGNQERVLHFAREFLADPLYAVRRAAYRVIARSSPHEYSNLCQSWSYSKHEQQRCRAGEALLWIDTKNEAVFGSVYKKLLADEVLSVRESAERTQLYRRQRLWAQAYLETVTTAIASGIEGRDVPFGVGQALAKCGDEDSRLGIIELLDKPDLPPHVRHWLERVLKDVEKNFAAEAKKWPEPWVSAEGAIEEVNGQFEPENRRERWDARISLWRKFAAVGGYGEWGGSIWPADASAAFDMHRSLGSSAGYLHIAGKRPAKVLLVESIYGKTNLCTFVGSGAYPSDL